MSTQALSAEVTRVEGFGQAVNSQTVLTLLLTKSGLVVAIYVWGWFICFQVEWSRATRCLVYMCFGNHEILQGWWLEHRQLSSLAIGTQEDVQVVLSSSHFAKSRNMVAKLLDLYLVFLNYLLVRACNWNVAKLPKMTQLGKEQQSVCLANFTIYSLSYATFQTAFFIFPFKPSLSLLLLWYIWVVSMWNIFILLMLNIGSSVYTFALTQCPSILTDLLWC